jgi:hypothetical protein
MNKKHSVEMPVKQRSSEDTITTRKEHLSGEKKIIVDVDGGPVRKETYVDLTTKRKRSEDSSTTETENQLVKKIKGNEGRYDNVSDKRSNERIKQFSKDLGLGPDEEHVLRLHERHGNVETLMKNFKPPGRGECKRVFISFATNSLIKTLQGEEVSGVVEKIINDWRLKNDYKAVLSDYNRKALLTINDQTTLLEVLVRFNPLRYKTSKGLNYGFSEFLKMVKSNRDCVKVKPVTKETRTVASDLFKPQNLETAEASRNSMIEKFIGKYKLERNCGKRLLHLPSNRIRTIISDFKPKGSRKVEVQFDKFIRPQIK